MRLLIFVCALLAAKAAQLPGYSYQGPSTGGVPLPSIGSNQQTSSQHSGFGGAGVANTSPVIVGGHDSLEYSGAKEDCEDGHVRHHDGTCVTPKVTQNVFVYAAPEQEPTEPPKPAYVPLPKVENNIVFIKNEEPKAPQDPIIVPPPQKKHIIYVLNKESEDLGPKVIEVSTQPPQNPEVFFVNYGEGDTPTLPNGIDFETALKSAVHSGGQVTGGIGHSGIGAATGGSSLAGTGGFTAGTGSRGSGTGASILTSTGGLTSGRGLSGGSAGGSSLTGAGGFTAGSSLSGTGTRGFKAASSLSGAGTGRFNVGGGFSSSGTVGTGVSGPGSSEYAGSGGLSATASGAFTAGSGLSGAGLGGITGGSSVVAATGGFTGSSTLSGSGIGIFGGGSGSGASGSSSVSSPHTHYGTP